MTPDDTIPLLRARGVRKTYGVGESAVEALRGIDLDIERGDCVAIMGPSGNGKTTLLNCLSGLDDIDAGTIEFDGHDLATMSDAKRTEQRAAKVGFVFQSFNLIPVFSAVENVELPLLLAGAAGRTVRQRATEMLERVGLGARLAHRPTELSGGEQQRVAIARALVNEPALVWADEPTGNLDIHTAASVLDLLLEIPTEGRSLVIITHDPDIGSRARRLVHVEDGRITADDRQSDETGQTPSVVGQTIRS